MGAIFKLPQSAQRKRVTSAENRGENTGVFIILCGTQRKPQRSQR